MDEHAAAALADDDGGVVPDYDASIVTIPDTVGAMHGLDTDRPLDVVTDQLSGVDHVVVYVVDALGWAAAARLADDIPALGRLVETAPVTQPLTSTYPSETAAAMTSLFTGLQPVEHGLIGWFTRFETPTGPYVGHSLPFRDREGRSLAAAHDIEATQLFDLGPRRPITDTLVDAGVDTTFHLPAGIVDSHASHLSAGAANRRGYETIGGALEAVRTSLEAATSPTYHLVYEPTVDEAGHHHGPDGAPYRDAVAGAIEPLVDRLLDRLDPSVAARTAVLVTADHGQVTSMPADRIDIERLDAAADGAILGHRETAGGDPLFLAGGPRNVQLHLDSEGVDAAQAALSAAIDGRVMRPDAYAGLFGDRRRGDRFGRRAPDLLVVPDQGGLWFDDSTLAYTGLHGGFDPEEMVVPLVAGTADELADR